MSVTVNLNLWPDSSASGSGSGVRIGLAMSGGPIMERDNLGTPGIDYPGNPRNVYLMDAASGGTQGIVGTVDTNSILNLTRTGNTAKGYWWDFATMQWFPAGGDGAYTVSAAPANFALNLWSHPQIFDAASEVKATFTNFNAIASGGVNCPSGRPSLGTQLTPSSTITGGTPVTDQAALTGGSTTGLTGTVSYSFFYNGYCSGGGTTEGNVSVGAGSTIGPSNPVTIWIAGSYSFLAFYSGDSNNNAATSSCETLTVTAFYVGGDRWAD